ncbi:hypothetical protein HK097_008642 [Rhizophlyctis rosea]|uniref:Uncharacterized protein n=1 Tax=Rhizophlyctis rosea TaxID=64517 RepID=A0AAD5SA69_9FUNG|nr:hypothetical protein HK097_008642 [Rhizophlyctis rosea]
MGAKKLAKDQARFAAKDANRAAKAAAEAARIAEEAEEEAGREAEAARRAEHVQRLEDGKREVELRLREETEARRQAEMRAEEEREERRQVELLLEEEKGRSAEEKRELLEKLKGTEEAARLKMEEEKLEELMEDSEVDKRRLRDVIYRLRNKKRELDERMDLLEVECTKLRKQLQAALRSITRWYPYLNPDQLGTFLASIRHETIDIVACTKKNRKMIEDGEKYGYTHQRVARWIQEGTLRVVDESMHTQIRLKGEPEDSDPVLAVYNANGIPDAPFPIISPEDQRFICNAYHLITKMRRNLAKLRSTSMKGGTMYGYGIRAGFVRGVRFDRYAFEPKHLRREEVWELVIKMERDLALILANIGRSYFPWTWEKNIQLQMDLDTQGLGDGVPGVGGNLIITRDYQNTVHTDEDRAPAWGMWCLKDLVYTGDKERTPEQLALLLDGVPYLVSPEIGIAVKLYHGAVLNWDAGRIKHATSETIFKRGFKGQFGVFGAAMQWADALVRRADSRRRILLANEDRDDTMDKLWMYSLKKKQAEAKGKVKGKVVAEGPTMETFLAKEFEGENPWKEFPKTLDISSSKRTASPHSHPAKKARSSKQKAQEPELQLRRSTRGKGMEAMDLDSESPQPQPQPQPQAQPQPKTLPKGWAYVLEPQPQPQQALTSTSTEFFGQRKVAMKAMEEIKGKKMMAVMLFDMLELKPETEAMWKSLSEVASRYRNGGRRYAATSPNPNIVPK